MITLQNWIKEDLLYCNVLLTEKQANKQTSLPVHLYRSLNTKIEDNKFQVKTLFAGSVGVACPGGTHIGRWYVNMPPSRPPFSGHILAPETHLFKRFSHSRDPLGFMKNLVFQDRIFCSGDPSFKPQNQFWSPFWRPYF